MTEKRGRGAIVTTGRSPQAGGSAILIRLSAAERAELDAAVPSDQAAWARAVILEAVRRHAWDSKR